MLAHISTWEVVRSQLLWTLVKATRLPGSCPSNMQVSHDVSLYVIDSLVDVCGGTVNPHGCGCETYKNKLVRMSVEVVVSGLSFWHDDFVGRTSSAGVLAPISYC